MGTSFIKAEWKWQQDTPLPNLGFVSIFQFLLQLTPNILLFSLIAIYSLRITHIKGEENMQMRITAS